MAENPKSNSQTGEGGVGGWPLIWGGFGGKLSLSRGTSRSSWPEVGGGGGGGGEKKKKQYADEGGQGLGLMGGKKTICRRRASGFRAHQGGKKNNMPTKGVRV